MRYIAVRATPINIVRVGSVCTVEVCNPRRQPKYRWYFTPTLTSLTRLSRVLAQYSDDDHRFYGEAIVYGNTGTFETKFYIPNGDQS